MVEFKVRGVKDADVNRKMCLLALDLAAYLCGDRTAVLLDGEHTMVSVPNEVIEEVKKRAGNPGTLEERVKVLRELEWSYNWAVGMCKLTHPDWETLPASEREKCINRMLEVLAERAFR